MIKLYANVRQGWLLLHAIEQVAIAVVLALLLGAVLSNIAWQNVSLFISSLLLFVLAGAISVVLCLIARPCKI